jgi:3-oxo-5-alpha-steroid 4-dehydrogenase 1
MNPFYIYLIVMAAIAVVVFVALFFVKAGYGLFTSKSWGLAINNKIAWCLMESPVFLVMLILWAFAPTDHKTITTLCCLLIFEIHYFQRSFIFPFLLKGNSKMPLSVMFMGVFFNILNALMQGGWLFYFSPASMYSSDWLLTPQFICGTIIFFIGMYINIDSDRRIRNLRKPGDTKHYMPTGGMYNYVSSANYFGEFVEWVGFALLTWSWSGAVFAVWTFANLAPRANSINKKYAEMFGEEFTSRKVKRMIPFIY